jgi:hypothetical protein
MSKFGININLNVSKIDKSKIKDGKYLNLTVFMDSEKQDQYGSNGGIFHQQSKEESSAKVDKIFVGNTKVFWVSGEGSATKQAPKPKTTPQIDDDLNDDIPF